MRLRFGHRIARRAAEHDDVTFAVERLDQPFRGLFADLGLAFGHAVDEVLAQSGETIAGGERNSRYARRGRFARRFRNRGAGVEEGDDDIKLLRDQAFDIGNLLLGLELAVGVADLGDVLALRCFILEFDALDVAPVVAAPTVRQRDLDRLRAAEFVTLAENRPPCLSCPDRV